MKEDHVATLEWMEKDMAELRKNEALTKELAVEEY